MREHEFPCCEAPRRCPGDGRHLLTLMVTEAGLAALNTTLGNELHSWSSNPGASWPTELRAVKDQIDAYWEEAR